MKPGAWRGGVALERGGVARDIRASADVRALVGAELLRRLHDDPFGRFDCCLCGRGGDTARPTTVLVERYRSAHVVMLAHAGCADSQVVVVDADAPSEVEAAGLGDMTAKMAVLAYPARPVIRPVLVLEPRVEVAAPTEGGESVDLWMSGLLDSGLALMRTGGQMPGRVRGCGWRSWALARCGFVAGAGWWPMRVSAACLKAGVRSRPRSVAVSFWLAVSACTRLRTKT
jgi:hypothetical protein